MDASRNTNSNKAEQELTRLDNRIADQRRRYNGAAESDEDAKRRARPSGSNAGLKRPPAGSVNPKAAAATSNSRAYVRGDGAVTSIPPAVRNNLAQLESDISTKSQARPNQIASKPGAFFHAPNRGGLEQLEADIASKSRSQNNSNRNCLNQLESDLEAKASAALPSRQTQTQTQHHRQQLHAMESALASKMQRAGPPPPPSMAPPSQAELSQLERDLMIKQSALPTTLPNSSMVARLPTPASMNDGDEVPSNPPYGYMLSQQNQQQHREMKNSDEAGFVNVADKQTGAAIPPETVFAAVQDKLTSRGGDNNALTAMEATYKAENFNGGQGGAGESNENRLAVAVAVDDDKSDEFIPAAVEYDPDAKPPIYKSRRFRIYGAVLLAVLLATACGIGFGLSKSDSKGAPEEVPSSPPTTFRESLGIQEQLERLVGSQQLSDVEGPYYRAMQWLMYGDPKQLTPDDSNFAQRYILALFYYQSSRDKEWRSCNPPKNGETGICNWQELQDDFSYITRPAYRWLTGETECFWAGVECDAADQVKEIKIFSQELTGTLPSELSKLPSLVSIDLGSNELSGPIPEEFGEMGVLAHLDLHYNELTGTIPDSIWSMESLDRLTLGSNKLEGTISTLIGNLKQLKSLYLFNNKFVGTIPTEIGGMPALWYVRMHKNQLVGTIPTEFGNLRLAELYLHKNGLNGSFPSELGKLTSLVNLRLHANQFIGELPDTFYNMERLSIVHLYDNQFSGTLSTEIGKMSGMGELLLRDNNFRGAIPSVIGTFNLLREAWFEGNDFEGPVPEEICSLRTHEDTTFNGETLLFELVADCLPKESDGEIQVPCAAGCCTGCCDPETGDCELYAQ